VLFAVVLRSGVRGISPLGRKQSIALCRTEKKEKSEGLQSGNFGGGLVKGKFLVVDISL
jgi:hypothetical protein